MRTAHDGVDERRWGVGVDAAQFDELYASTARRLVAQLYAMTGDLAEAQDCVQEAFVVGWRRRHQLEQHRSPEAWLRTVAWRLAVSRWRRTRAALTAYRRHGPPPDAPEPVPEHVALVTALRRLDPDQRRVIVLHHLCDLSVRDVAEETEVAVGTVKSRLARGRTALAALLDDTRTQEANHV